MYVRNSVCRSILVTSALALPAAALLYKASRLVTDEEFYAYGSRK